MRNAKLIITLFLAFLFLCTVDSVFAEETVVRLKVVGSSSGFIPINVSLQPTDKAIALNVPPIYISLLKRDDLSFKIYTTEEIDKKMDNDDSRFSRQEQAIKDLNELVAQLQANISSLSDKNDALTNRLDDIENKSSTGK